MAVLLCSVGAAPAHAGSTSFSFDTLHMQRNSPPLSRFLHSSSSLAFSYLPSRASSSAPTVYRSPYAMSSSSLGIFARARAMAASRSATSVGVVNGGVERGPIGGRCSKSLLTAVEPSLFCGDNGYTFPGLLDGDCPMTACILWPGLMHTPLGDI